MPKTTETTDVPSTSKACGFVETLGCGMPKTTETTDVPSTSKACGFVETLGCGMPKTTETTDVPSTSKARPPRIKVSNKGSCTCFVGSEVLSEDASGLVEIFGCGTPKTTETTEVSSSSKACGFRESLGCGMPKTTETTDAPSSSKEFEKARYCILHQLPATTRVTTNPCHHCTKHLSACNNILHNLKEDCLDKSMD
ncbi:uncharacterized protein LOC126845507 [Adelges cooleyi]|uniref:uncharacterized protein LOC126845507 n=1 Tax=Adelges cooleyi TaxID=133065 RepID=UPI00217FA9E8|nr:uncharacterized protein LOC126845507 [Adelges cooleyi]